MGLFDDLLGSKNATPQPETPVVPMPQGQTATPPNVDELLNISAGNITPEMPSYTAQKELESQNSPIIVNSVEENISPVVSAVENNPIIISDSPVISAEISPVVAEENAIVSPVIMAEENISPVVESTENILVHPVSEPVALETSAPVLDFSLTETMPTIAEATIPETTISDNFSLLEEEKSEENNNLFAMAQTPEEKNISEFSEPQMTPENTEGFITASLLQLEKMETSLVDRKNNFLAEAEKYRQEKEKFEELEKQAIENSRSMDDEQAKIDSMKKYFTKQLQGPNINDSVSTALTGISVQNAVDENINKKSSTRKKTTVTA